MMLKGTGWMLVLAVASAVFGALVGALVALMRLAKIPILATLAAVYVIGFRGTPLLVQLFFVYFGLPSISIKFDPITAGILGLSLNVGAYLSETLGVPSTAWHTGNGTRRVAWDSPKCRSCVTLSVPRPCAWRCPVCQTV